MLYVKSMAYHADEESDEDKDSDCLRDMILKQTAEERIDTAHVWLIATMGEKWANNIKKEQICHKFMAYISYVSWWFNWIHVKTAEIQ